MAGSGRGWRGLGLFWTGIGVVVLVAGGVLQSLGPLPHGEPAVPARPVSPAHEATVAPVAEPAAPAVAHVSGVARPDPALLEPSRLFPPAQLPKVGADGRMARLVYAAPMVPAAKPMVALLMSGFGLSERESRAALALPGPVSLGVSPYATAHSGLLEASRMAGHELLASVPMEPQGYPLNDEGTRSLRTGLPPEDNRQNLEWTLGRVPGAVGATGASDGMRGERFAEVSAAYEPVLDEIGRRGLLYVDPRPGRMPERPGLAGRSVDVVIDDSPARADIEAKLRDLERVARERGSAIGLVGSLRPVTTERVAAWTKGLAAAGITLVPVSELVNGEGKP